MMEPAADCHHKITNETVTSCPDSKGKDAKQSKKHSLFFGDISGRVIGKAISQIISEVLIEKAIKSDSINPEIPSILTEEVSKESPKHDDKPRGRGRPVITRLCSKFKDAAVWSMAKTIFHKIYHESIQLATNLAQYLVCFFCSLFRVADLDDSSGCVTHYYNIMKEHFSKAIMPAKRTLQFGVQWLMDKKQIFFRSSKEKLREKEEAKHKLWEKIEEEIYGHMVQLAPEFAAY